MRYPLKNREEELKKAGILDITRRILDRAIAEGWSVDEFRAVVDREVALIDDETDLHNRKARDRIVRRELGLSHSEILTPALYARVFIDCDEPPRA